MQPFDDRDGEIWLDGHFVPWRDAKLHVLSHGLHYASSVFEGERCYAGHIFHMQEHHERLKRSAEIMDFPLPCEVRELDDAATELLQRLGLENAYIRPVAWRGSEQMGVRAREAGTRIAIAAWEWPSYFSAEERQRGLKLMISPWRRPPPECAPVHAKAAGLYMICTLAKHAAQDAGFEDALMLDAKGNLSEATGANLFLVIDGQLHTPTPECFLDGITRRTIMALARAKGIEVVERTLEVGELRKASEVFITGTAAEVTPVGQIDELKFPAGPITASLAEAYTSEVLQAPGQGKVPLNLAKAGAPPFDTTFKAERIG